MKIFNPQPTRHENKRKQQRSTKSAAYRQWLQPMAWSLVLVILVCSVWRLNIALAVKQWDIQAEAGLKQQIHDFLQQQANMGFWQSRASVLQAQLQLAIPDIENVEVRRVLPDGLMVQAVARVPIALWTSLDGETVMLVDHRAQVYRPLQAGEVWDLPLFRLAEEDLKQASKLLRLFGQDDKRRTSLSEVIVEHHRWRLNFSRGEQWQLQANHLEQDVQRIMAILEQPRWRNAYWRMDARIPQRWFLRPATQGVI